MERSKNPWISIWTHPRETIAKIVSENPNRSLWLLAAIYGFCSLLNLSQSLALGASLNTLAILFLTIVLSPLYGWVSFAIWSGFVLITGKLFKGQGNFQTIRAAYAWSCVPLAVNIPLWLLMLLIFQGAVFVNFPDAANLNYFQICVLFAVMVGKVILAIWSLVIFINGLAEVQKYSVLKSIFNIILAAIVLGILFFLFWSVLLKSFGVIALNTLLIWKPF